MSNWRLIPKMNEMSMPCLGQSWEYVTRYKGKVHNLDCTEPISKNLSGYMLCVLISRS